MENIHTPSKSDRPDLWFEEDICESSLDKDSNIIQIPQDNFVATAIPRCRKYSKCNS